MRETHLRESELAHIGDGKLSTEVAEHLRWCTRCSSAAADYRWLQTEITATLSMRAHKAPAPQPRWQDVRQRLCTYQRRLMEMCRIAAASTIGVAISLMLVASPIPVVATGTQALPPQPTPDPSSATFNAPVSATPTPALTREVAVPPSTPVLVPNPTPPEPLMAGGT